jgi:Domain of unknown function (DUF4189)
MLITRKWVIFAALLTPLTVGYPPLCLADSISSAGSCVINSSGNGNTIYIYGSYCAPTGQPRSSDQASPGVETAPSSPDVLGIAPLQQYAVALSFKWGHPIIAWSSSNDEAAIARAYDVCTKTLRDISGSCQTYLVLSIKNEECFAIVDDTVSLFWDQDEEEQVARRAAISRCRAGPTERTSYCQIRWSGCNPR